MSQALLIESGNGVLRLRMNRPAVHNAFDDALIAELTAALQAAAMGPERVVVLESEGASFSAGADLNWMRSLIGADEQTNVADAARLALLMRTLNELPKPTIAKVQGAAFGGGVGLIACCDMAIGASTALFALSEAKLGLLPAVISPYVIEAIGARQARRYFASAERFDAGKALQMGLLHDVVAPEELDATVEVLIKTLLSAGPVASGSAKQLIRDVLAAEDTTTQDALTAARIATLRVSPEGQEGLTAFLEKRKPTWMSF